MNSKRPTLAVYGIQDHGLSDTPLTVHDHSVAFYADGQLVKLLQLERLTRNKRDNTLHDQLFDILKSAQLIAPEYDLVFVDNVIGRAFISRQGNMRFEAPLAVGLKTGLEKGVCYWVDRARDAYVLNHELAHVFSCLPFFGKFKDNSLLVHFDGGASQSNFSAWRWKDDALKLVEYNWDLKYLSAFFNANALNFAILGAGRSDQNAVPGKLMGFAAYGNYNPVIEAWLRENDYFQDIWRSKKMFFHSARETFGYKHDRMILEDPFIQDIAATFQEIFTRDVLFKLSDLQAQTGADYLYYTGGSALNIVTNSRLLKEKIFKNVFVPPCAEDSGLALGAGAYVEFIKHGSVQACSPYSNNWGIESYHVDYTLRDIETVAALLMAGKVIGVCNGFGEVGPRALGNRSIIALADCCERVKRVSQFHKGREWYRPTAPIMLENYLSYFTGLSGDYPLSHYMLMDFEILPARREEIAGVVHANGTARIQAVKSRKDNPYMFDLLSHLAANHGVHALVNTSFNAQGEPIVHTCADALSSAVKMRLDGVVLNGKLQVFP